MRGATYENRGAPAAAAVATPPAMPALRIEPIRWDDEDWPHVASYTSTE